MRNDKGAWNPTTMIALIRALGLMGEPHEATHAEPLTDDDPSLISDFLRRHEEPRQPPESTEEPKTGEARPPSKETKS